MVVFYSCFYYVLYVVGDRMNVLSLFDGMSCGRIALERAGIPVENYFAAEIDKYAIQIAQKNYPEITQLGDVRDINEKLHLPSIDLVIGGSPCQGFSRAGKGLNFEDPRSALFFEYVRILNEVRPEYFLLENVQMKQEHQDVVNEYLGVEPIKINSALVSAQNRVRLYWTNIPDIVQPEDKKIMLRDILEKGVVDREKSYCIDANYFKGGNLKSYFGKRRRQLVFEDRPCELRDFDSNADCHHVANATDINGHDSLKRVYAESGKGPTLNACTGGNREPKVLIVPEATKKGYTEIQNGDCFDATFPTSKTRRGRNMKDKSNCLTAANYDYMRYEHPTYRKLTPTECERLQTVPDSYTEGVSNTQRYKMLGNGWTIDVIAHIFRHLPRWGALK